MAGEWAAAAQVSLGLLNAAITRAAQSGAPAAALRTKDSHPEEDEPVDLIEQHDLDLPGAEQWLFAQSRDGFVGVLAFSCVNSSSGTPVILSQCLDTRNGVRIQQSMPAKRTFTGKYKTVGTCADFEILDRGDS